MRGKVRLWNYKCYTDTSIRASITATGTTGVTGSTTCEPGPGGYKMTDGCWEEYEGQFPCKSGTSGKCPAANRYVKGKQS